MINAAFRPESLDLIPMGVYIVDRGGALQHYNKRAAELWGYAPPLCDTRVAFAPLQIFTPDGRPLAHELRPVAEALARASSQRDVEVIIQRPDGQRIHVVGNIGPLHDAAGNFVGVINCFQDITDRRRAEQATRHRDQQFREIADTAPAVFWTTDPSNRCTFLNRGWYELTAQEDDAALGFGWTEAVHPDDRETARQTFLGAAARHEPFAMDFRLRRADGSYAWVADSGRPRYSDRGEYLGYVGTVIDITPRKLAEHALAESEARYRTTFDQAAVGVAHCALDGRWIRINQPLCDILGYTMTELEGGCFQDITHPQDLQPNLDLKQQLLAGAIPSYALEKRYIRKDGSIVWAKVVASLARKADGSPDYLIAVIEDVDRRKRMEAELREATRESQQANDAKDQFLAALSHELRTPLTPILMSAAALERDASLPLAVREELGLVRRNVELEARLIDDLLDLTRISRGKIELHLEPVNAHALLREAVQTCCGSDINNKRLEVTTDCRAARHHVTADPARLQQVFWNLIKNAVKFTPPGGRISISTRDAGGDGEADGGGGELLIEVRDTGIGVEPALLPRIFDAFEQGSRDVTRQFGGLGLGLAISKALVDLHDGRITAHSDGAGAGATFTIALPTVAAPPPKLDRDGDGHTTRGLRILLVEDHATTARVLGRLLREAKHDVHISPTLTDARDAAQQRRFDLLISDLGLPDGSGLELMRELAASYQLKGIALSGYGMDDDVRRSRDVGFATHLTKPVDFRKLQAAINQVTGR